MASRVMRVAPWLEPCSCGGRKVVDADHLGARGGEVMRHGAADGTEADDDHVGARRRGHIGVSARPKRGAAAAAAAPVAKARNASSAGTVAMLSMFASHERAVAAL